MKHETNLDIKQTGVFQIRPIYYYLVAGAEVIIFAKKYSTTQLRQFLEIYNVLCVCSDYC